MLVDGVEEGAWMIEQDRFGAIAMVDVKVQNGDRFQALMKSFECADGDGIEVAETHRVIPGGMVAGRSKQAKGGLAGAGLFESLQDTSDAAHGMGEEIGVSGGIVVERSGGLSNLVDQFLSMGSKHLGVGGWDWAEPVEFDFLLLLEPFD